MVVRRRRPGFYPHPNPTRQPQAEPSAALASRSQQGHPPKDEARTPPAQPLEPILFPKLRIYFADFPDLHYSIDQRLLT